MLTREREVDPQCHGSGLGLWLINLVVQQSDGTLAYADNDPQGSIITIRLPAS